MTDSGVNDTSVRSCRRTRPGVRRPWRQPATVRLLWLHTGSGRHGKTVGEDDYQVRPDSHGKPCVQHINIQVRSTNTAERERFFSKGRFTKGQFFRKRTSPRVSCVQTRSHQGGSLSFRRKRKSGSDRTVFFGNGLRQG